MLFRSNDKKSRDGQLKIAPNAKFYILTDPITYDGEFPYKKAY